MAVCLGNICRSPLAHGILEHLSSERKLNWEIESAGTSSYHVGESPCFGSTDVARKGGIDISKQKSRQFNKSDFAHYDLILAMDTSNYNDLIRLSSDEKDKAKVKMVLNYSYPGENRSVPDSYYIGNYQEVFDLLYEACIEIIEEYK